MTTTSTFQGMAHNAKPSSRVLAPPGGGSNNIFGGNDDDSQKKHTPSNPQNINRGNNDIFGNKEQLATSTSPGKKHNPDNVNCGNNDIFNREEHAAPSQPKSRAPRSGDDSFHKLFGDTSFDDTNKGKDVCVDSSKGQKEVQSKLPSSFANVYGDGEPGSVRTPDLRARNRYSRDNSFSKVFNQGQIPKAVTTVMPLAEDPVSKPHCPSASMANPNQNITQSMCEDGSHALSTSLNNLSLGGGDSFVEDDHDINSSFSRVLGQYQANVTPRANRFSDRGEYNPITGMPYAQPAEKEETQTKNDEEAKKEQDLQEKANEAAAAAAKVENKQQQQQKSHPSAGSGIFGGPEPTSQVQSSTRVSQPPGGRSTKLW
ncbi:hematological and neurological expressed 1-like protein-like [Plakobranchus ocellatus]|uniref:Microtubule-associated protein Jupiter n=1 Tax=Plakobranchus ocellatus TaxID=259542 RepID=A0AAV4BAX0_9GAST|nr:hematological and neurological expressed 1-like protein-like [Plakobranchus ocellatus]